MSTKPSLPHVALPHQRRDAFILSPATASSTRNNNATSNPQQNAVAPARFTAQINRSLSPAPPRPVSHLHGSVPVESEVRPRTAPGNRSSASNSLQHPMMMMPLPSHQQSLQDHHPILPQLAALPKHISSFSSTRHQHHHHIKSSPSLSLDSSSVPTQTIMKALVSRPPPNSQLAISTIQSLRNSARSDDLNFAAVARTRRLSEAMSDMNLDAAESHFGSDHHRLSALNSPCFYHKRFDEIVDIDRVLCELQEDDGWLSHSRLMQTATGVREVSRQLQRKPIKRAVRNVMIVTKARDNDLVVLTRELAAWLLTTPRYGSDVGVNVYVDSKLCNSKRFDAAGLVAGDARFHSMLRYWTSELCWSSPEKFDLVLTLGGDGTVLYTSWLFQRIVPPILSFSLGSLGFLTNFEFANYQKALDAVMGDAGMRVNLRMRFTCTVYRANRSGSNANSGSNSASNSSHPNSTDAADSSACAVAEEAEQFEVLNEVVIDRGPSPYVSNLEIHGDDNLLTVVQADGCIFSTPTGSTAYSLSAGGSLVHPDIPAILLTPICPHTLSFRPMLLRDSMALRVAVPRGSRATAYAAFDGKGRVELKEGDSVTIVASQYPFPTVLSREGEWVDCVSRTLRWNTRGATQKAWKAENGSDGEQGGEPEFDIDFGDDEGRDSGYSGEGSSAGWGNGSSPKRGRLMF